MRWSILEVEGNFDLRRVCPEEYVFCIQMYVKQLNKVKSILI